MLVKLSLFKRLSLGIFCIMILSGCINNKKISYNGYKTRLSNLYGADVEYLLLHWGEPDKKISLSNNQAIYEYNKSPIACKRDRWESKPTKIDWLHGTSTYTQIMVKQDCQTKFLINIKNNKIISSSFSGADCLAKEG